MANEGTLTMKRYCLFLLPIVISLHGCSCPNQMNDTWKRSIAQLRITTVMPLRERLEIGEVYRYFKRPVSYFEESQIEPPIAFTIDGVRQDINDSNEKWPTFVYEGKERFSLGALAKSIKILSVDINDNDTIRIDVNHVFSKQTREIDIADKFLKINESNQLVVQEKYVNTIKKLGNIKYRLSLLWPLHFLREHLLEDGKWMYLRVPVKVYYAKSINVSITRGSKKGAETKVFDANLIGKISEMPDVNVIFASNTTVILNENFNVPMVIGFRGLLYKVRPKDGRIEENIEDLR